MTTIAMFDTKPYDQTFFEVANHRFKFDIKYLKPHLTRDTVTLAQGFDCVSVFVNDEINRTVMYQLADQGVKLIALRCSGFNNIDLEAARDCHIGIVRVPAYSPYAVAEYALTLILALNRKIHKAYNRTREHNFSIQGLLGFDLHGKTAGIIGTGKIGICLIRILNGLGMHILAYDPFPNPELSSQEQFKYTSLDELYAASDLISLHCPLTDSTHHLINHETIRKMKKGVMIINTGRGKLIDSKALLHGLKTGHIGSAGLDVYEEEENYFFEDHSERILSDDILQRLLTFYNVLITSHQAFFTQEALQNISDTTLNNIHAYLVLKSPVNLVSL